MLHIFVIQHNYRSRYLDTIDSEHFMINIYKYEKCKFEEAFLLLKPCKKFVEKSRICRMTEFAEVCDSSVFDGNTIIVESDDNENIFVSGF